MKANHPVQDITGDEYKALSRAAITPPHKMAKKVRPDATDAELVAKAITKALHNIEVPSISDWPCTRLRQIAIVHALYEQRAINVATFGYAVSTIIEGADW